MRLTNIELASLEAKDEIGGMLWKYLAELGASESYPHFHQYWMEPAQRFPYLIKRGTSIAGFAFVRLAERFEVAEFYVVPECRRIDVGRSAVDALLRKHTGSWLVSVFPGNERALAFWRSVLMGASIESLVEESQIEPVKFYFESTGAH